MKKAVIWDCDGVLVDSEIIAMRVAGEVINDELKRLGRDTLDVDQFIVDYAGGHFSQMLKAYNITEDLDRIDAIKVRRTIDELTSRVETFNLLPEALQAAQQRNMKQAVATSSELNRVLPCLEKHNLTSFFTNEALPHIYSAVNSLPVAKPKPDPDVYQLALQQLGVLPEEAVAIEDSVSGVKSAIAAGLQVIGYVGGSHIPVSSRQQHAEKLKSYGAAVVIDSYESFVDAVKLLEWSNEGERSKSLATKRNIHPAQNIS